uniref:DUF4939 domain-containing protein n=1 Tax=Cyprinus carpio TaxID=7962 RepID=A0A8C1UEB3_CYPCA
MGFSTTDPPTTPVLDVLPQICLAHCLADLHSTTSELGNLLRAALTATSIPRSASVSPMVLPVSYAGEPAGCGSFLKVLLYIEAQPQKFSIDRSKVAFLISLLSGRALQWAKALLSTYRQRLNPRICWDSSEVVCWSQFCEGTPEVLGIC